MKASVRVSYKVSKLSKVRGRCHSKVIGRLGDVAKLNNK